MQDWTEMLRHAVDVLRTEKSNEKSLSYKIFFPLVDIHTSLNENWPTTYNESTNYDLLRGSPVAQEQDSLAVLGYTHFEPTRSRSPPT